MSGVQPLAESYPYGGDAIPQVCGFKPGNASSRKYDDIQSLQVGLTVAVAFTDHTFEAIATAGMATDFSTNHYAQPWGFKRIAAGE